LGVVFVGVILSISSLGSGFEAVLESCLLLNDCLPDSNWCGRGEDAAADAAATGKISSVAAFIGKYKLNQFSGLALRAVSISFCIHRAKKGSCTQIFYA
jgi:hypothetical protein